MPEPTSTQTLLQRVRGGDRESLNELYSRYQLQVRAVVRSRLGPELRRKLDSGDIAQDALLASLKSVQSFDQTSEGAFLNWLAKIVENRIRDHLDYFRAEKRDHRLERPIEGQRSAESAAPHDLPEKSGPPTPSKIMVVREDLGRLEKAMNRLPEESRNVIVAVKIEGRTYDEIAKTLGKTPDAVRMQVNRDLRALQNTLSALEVASTFRTLGQREDAIKWYQRAVHLSNVEPALLSEFLCLVVEEHGVHGLLRELPVYDRNRSSQDARLSVILNSFSSWAALASGNETAALEYLNQACLSVHLASQQRIFGEDEGLVCGVAIHIVSEKLVDSHGLLMATKFLKQYPSERVRTIRKVFLLSPAVPPMPVPGRPAAPPGLATGQPVHKGYPDPAGSATGPASGLNAAAVASR